MEKKKQTDDYLYLKHAIENMMPANKILGLKILKIQSGYAYIQIPFKEEFIGDFIQKRWHGGILASIADTAGGVVGATLLNSIQDKLNTIDMRIDYLHGAIIGDIFAEAKIVKNGKTIIKVDIELFQNDRKDPVAIARCVYSVLRDET
ncbi:MAG: PaaI family thioesterase [Lutibacter sp.]|nr:phenylacetic acid degradation protein [Lutibacter sp.]